jgi:DNA-directed RNA polymerase subunit M/transcription elongation factor TFIIS
MSNRFCSECENLLLFQTIDKLTLYCDFCNRYEKTSERDTLLYSEVIQGNESILNAKTYLLNAKDDIIASSEFKYCNQCKKETIVRSVSILNESGKKIYICSECGWKFQ